MFDNFSNFLSSLGEEEKERFSKKVPKFGSVKRANLSNGSVISKTSKIGDPRVNYHNYDNKRHTVDKWYSKEGTSDKKSQKSVNEDDTLDISEERLQKCKHKSSVVHPVKRKKLANEVSPDTKNPKIMRGSASQEPPMANDNAVLDVSVAKPSSHTNEEIPLIQVLLSQKNGEEEESYEDLAGESTTPTSSKEVKLTQLNITEENSVRLVNGKFIDFSCTICKKLPRKLNRSELYRHYSVCHFSSELAQEFGHLEVCPHCNLELRNLNSASHFGQKHNFVEKYLPVEAWIPGGWNKTTGKKIIKKVTETSDPPVFVWPEIPLGFDPAGEVRGINSCIEIQSSFDGFEIEIDEDARGLEEETLAKESSAHEEVIESNTVIVCQVCKSMLDKKQEAVTHVQTKHHMMGSGDLFHDYGMLLRTGYLLDVSVSSKNTVEEVSKFSQESTANCEAEGPELTKEEWELLLELNVKDLEEIVAMDNAKKVNPASTPLE